MSQVFVSYSRKDSDAVEPMKQALRRAGFSVGPDAASAGDDFGEQLRRGLEAAQCVIVIWSKAAAESQWAQEEMRHAMRAWSSGRLVLAALDDTPLPLGLRDISAIPLGADSDACAKQLIEHAKAIVAAGEAREKPVAPALAEADEFAAFLKQNFEPRGDLAGILASPAHPEAPASARRFGRVGVALASLAVVGALVLVLGFIAFQSRVVAPPAHKSEPAFRAPAPTATPPKSEPASPAPPQAEAPVPRVPAEQASPASLVAIILGVLLLGAAIGAGAVWAWSARARWRAKPLPIMTVTQKAPTEGGLQVFISYSHQDVGIVDGLVKQIEDMGYPVWIDPEAHGSQRYAAPIVEAIRTSKVVALMCSRSAFASDHFIREIYVAGGFKKPFIAFQLDPTDIPDDVLYFVSGFPRIPIASVNQQQLRSEIARLAT